MVILSVCPSVRSSVCLTRPGTVSRPGERDFGFSPYDSFVSLVFCDKISCHWVKVVFVELKCRDSLSLNFGLSENCQQEILLECNQSNVLLACTIFFSILLTFRSFRFVLGTRRLIESRLILYRVGQKHMDLTWTFELL